MTLALEQIDPARNRFRIYRITVCHDLFGALCLFIEWGRRGRRLRARSEVFNDRQARDERLVELLAIRRRHGYVGGPLLTA